MAISVEESFPAGDFMQMQEQAIKRAREMQRRSKSDPHQRREPLQGSTSQRETMPQSTSAPPMIQSAKPKEKAAKKEKPSLSSLLNLDNDKALILPLLLFLGKEGADDMLLLALLYIMS